jgi:hypothetical protein
VAPRFVDGKRQVQVHSPSRWLHCGTTARGEILSVGSRRAACRLDQSKHNPGKAGFDLVVDAGMDQLDGLWAQSCTPVGPLFNSKILQLANSFTANCQVLTAPLLRLAV